jgi:hypothetical protein
VVKLPFYKNKSKSKYKTLKFLKLTEKRYFCRLKMIIDFSSKKRKFNSKNNQMGRAFEFRKGRKNETLVSDG